MPSKEEKRTERNSQNGDQGSNTVEISIDELDELIRQRVQEELSEREVTHEESSEPSRWSRREALGLFGLGVFGTASNGLLDRQTNDTTERIHDFEVPELTADKITANQVDVIDQLTVSGTTIDGTGSIEGTGLDIGVIYAETAADIQPAIDELAKENPDGTCGGVVKLGPKVYKPETTIWLKSGVTLSGVQRGKYDPNFHGGDFTNTTVISTENLPTGTGDIDTTQGVNTYSHSDPNGDNWHPHFPVIANYRTKPFQLRSREPTQEEADNWGHTIALENVVINAGNSQRWWDPANEPNGSTAEKRATYFGVYDAVLMEHSRNLRMENVQTRNFLGYGGFFNGCRHLIDRGSIWQGGATDYHGGALSTNIGYPPDPNVYTDGVWDVTVRGPPPAFLLEGHNTHRFVKGGWSDAEIVGTERVFLGDPVDYWNGDAPLTDPKDGEHVVAVKNGRLEMDNYFVSSEPGTGTSKHPYNGIWPKDNDVFLTNTSIMNAHIGVKKKGKQRCKIHQCQIAGCNLCVHGVTWIPDISNTRFENCGTGIKIEGTANQYGSITHVIFNDVDVGLGGFCNNPVYVFDADFRDCNTPIENPADFDQLTIEHRIG